ncbi:MAG: response regulator [Acidimicrobiales bacterium]
MGSCEPSVDGQVPDRTIRLVVIDDHALVREGICELLAQHDDLDVVGVAASVAAALAVLAAEQPDVALVDFRLADGSGLDVLDRAEQDDLGVRVLIVSAFDDAAYVTESVSRGASGYLLKTATSDELAGAVRAVAAGAVVLDHSLVHLLAHPAVEADPSSPVGFSSREMQVLTCLASGWTNRHIADQLGLNVRTVEGYVTELLSKLGVASRTEAALWAARHGVAPASGSPSG